MTFELRDVLLVAIRWAHAAAAAGLVGGSTLCLLVLGPLAGQAESNGVVRQRLEASFGEIVDLSLIVFLVSGGLLVFERLSSGAATPLYAGILGLKVVLSLVLYRWAQQVRRGRGWGGREAQLLVGSSFLVVLLAVILKTIFESGLRAG